MARPKHISTYLLLLLAPVAAFSHPGHADGSPLIHELSHALHYLVVLIAVGIWMAQSVGRALRSRAARQRSDD